MKINYISIINGLILLALILPESLHIKRSIHHLKKQKHKAPGWISFLELLSRLACMIMMIFPVIIREFQFTSMKMMMMYFMGNIALLAMYLLIYYFYFSNEKLWSGMLIAFLPILILLNTAYTLYDFPLAMVSFVYGFSHLFLAFLRHI